VNQKGVFLVGSDIGELVGKARLLSSTFVENNPASLEVSGRNGVTSQNVNRTFPFGIYQGNWLSISDWHGCRETFRNIIMNCFDVLRPLGETQGLGVVCLAAYNDLNYKDVELKSVVEFINNFLKDFSPSRYFLRESESAYNGYRDFYLLTNAGRVHDPISRTDCVRITFPVAGYDRGTRFTTASVLVNFLRHPESYLKDGKPLRKDSLIKSVAESLEKWSITDAYRGEGGRDPNNDPMFLLWLLLARVNFPALSHLTTIDNALLTGPSRLMSSALSNVQTRNEVIYAINDNNYILGEFFNNFNPNMDRIFRNGVLGAGVINLYDTLKEKYKKVIVAKAEVKIEPLNDSVAVKKPTPRKRKVTNLQA
jgi:hypothetical protein